MTEQDRLAARDRLSEEPEGVVIVRRSYEEEGDAPPAEEPASGPAARLPSS